MKSKLKFIGYFWTAGCIIQAVAFPKLFSEGISGFRNAPFSCLLTCSFLLFFWIVFFFGTVKTTIISVKIEGGEIFVKRYCGLGITRVYNTEQISGFKISALKARNNKNYEFLYLMIDDRKIAIVSEYYHSNYEDLKKHIVANGIKYIGPEEVGIIQYLKDVFSR
ncbi:MAG: hypothetical protein JWQ57_4990 [Mucilaginibacter sp.]|nr:hypothetical protein [Mucilaginibacter sp.]